MQRGALIAAVLAAPLLCLMGILGMLLLFVGGDAEANQCGSGGPGVEVTKGSLPNGSVAGYSGQQLANAAAIITAGQRLRLSARGQTIGVMTAMGESSLVVIDRGDAAGPDSRGLFQQRANGAWGTYTDRMSPTTSATNFYRALIRVPGWETLPPTLAAHQTQGNQDPFHYAPFWNPAVAVMRALAGIEVQGVAAGTGDVACSADAPADVAAGGWTKPALGPLASPFSPARVNPVTGQLRPHTGTDISPSCDAPIYAAGAGTVVSAGPVGGYGNLITIDHGSGIVTRYAHMYANGVLVHAGETVKAGKQIARVGSAGNSTGCHLHFEVRRNDQFIDPVPFLKARGVPL